MKRYSLLLACVGAFLLVGADAKEETKHSKDELAVFDLINKVRAKEKLPPFKANGKLIEAARSHSANMAKQGKMEHVLDGKTPEDRLDAVKYVYGFDKNDVSLVKENLAFMPDSGNLPTLVEHWLKSPTHGPNIRGKFDETGVGIVRGEGFGPTKGKKGLWITQVFAVPDKK